MQLLLRENEGKVIAGIYDPDRPDDYYCIWNSGNSPYWESCPPEVFDGGTDITLDEAREIVRLWEYWHNSTLPYSARLAITEAFHLSYLKHQEKQNQKIPPDVYLTPLAIFCAVSFLSFLIEPLGQLFISIGTFLWMLIKIVFMYAVAAGTLIIVPIVIEKKIKAYRKRKQKLP